jgi:hypothetical protein
VHLGGNFQCTRTTPSETLVTVTSLVLSSVDDADHLGERDRDREVKDLELDDRDRDEPERDESVREPKE